MQGCVSALLSGQSSFFLIPFLSAFKQGEFGDHNHVLYCDGCDLPQHQHCYNIPRVPDREAPYFCDYCVLANSCADPTDEPPPICALCRGKGGGLIRLLLFPPDEEGDDDDAQRKEDGDSNVEATGPSFPRFVHKTCALAGMGEGGHAVVRFVAGSNGGVALLAPSTLRVYDAAAEAGDDGKVQEGERRCRHCGSGYGLLLRCKGGAAAAGAGDGGCLHFAHASCAFEAASAALIVDVRTFLDLSDPACFTPGYLFSHSPTTPNQTQGSASAADTPPVRVWCLEHAPAPEHANPGADAVAACLGLLPPPGSRLLPVPPAPSADKGQQQQQDVLEPRHFRGPAALFGGYLDGKARLLLLQGSREEKRSAGPGRLVLVGRKEAGGGGAVAGGPRVVFALKDTETPRTAAGGSGGEGRGGAEERGGRERT